MALRVPTQATSIGRNREYRRKMARTVTEVETLRTERAGEKVDGRRASRERNRDAVVDALLDLYREGNVSPSADEVAMRSGLSRRSLFRYFDDLDDLCRAAIARQTQRAGHLIALKNMGEGSLANRITRLAAQRFELFEAIAPAARVGRLRAPYQLIVAEDIRKSRGVLHRQVEQHFAREMDMMEPDHQRETLAAADVVCSFESFDLLREAQGLSGNEYQRTIRRVLTALFQGTRQTKLES